MSGPKHDPGPWVVKQSDVFSFVRIETAYGLVIADLGGSAMEDEANARLLAAAPELLAQLQNMLSRFGGATDKETPAEKQARAAIAKATGAAP